MVSNGEAGEQICGVFVDDPELGSRMCGQPRRARAHGPDAFIENAHTFEPKDVEQARVLDEKAITIL